MNFPGRRGNTTENSPQLKPNFCLWFQKHERSILVLATLSSKVSFSREVFFFFLVLVFFNLLGSGRGGVRGINLVGNSGRLLVIRWC